MPALQYPRGFAREASLCLQDLVSSKSIADCLGVPTVGPLGTVGHLREAFVTPASRGPLSGRGSWPSRPAKQ